MPTTDISKLQIAPGGEKFIAKCVKRLAGSTALAILDAGPIARLLGCIAHKNRYCLIHEGLLFCLPSPNWYAAKLSDVLLWSDTEKFLSDFVEAMVSGELDTIYQDTVEQLV